MNGRRDWHELISQPVYAGTITEKDVWIPIRDGIRLASDIHRPDAEGKNIGG